MRRNSFENGCITLVIFSIGRPLRICQVSWLFPLADAGLSCRFISCEVTHPLCRFDFELRDAITSPSWACITVLAQGGSTHCAPLTSLYQRSCRIESLKGDKRVAVQHERRQGAVFSLFGSPLAKKDVSVQETLQMSRKRAICARRASNGVDTLLPRGDTMPSFSGAPAI